MIRKNTIIKGVLAVFLLGLSHVLPAQIDQRGGALKFNNAPAEMLLNDYGEKTGRTLLMAPNVPNVTITLRSHDELSYDEYLQAVETVLSMHGIAVLKVGDTFLKVVPINEARQHAMQIREEGEELPENGELVSQMIALRNIEIAEAQKAIEPLKHATFGQIHPFESINSILVTDTADNINRIMKIIEYIDQPIEAREEPHVIAIRHTKASDIKATLEEIIADSEEQQKRSTVPRDKAAGQPGVERATTVPGVIRARRTTSAQPETTAILDQLAEEQAERGIIRGKVKIVADDRTNILIIITRPENMKFFERIVSVLDVETAPDVIVRVYPLEYAEAKIIAEMLNDLIGKEDDKESVSPGSPAEGGEGKSKSLREISTSKNEASQAAGKSKVGQLSKENIKILSDERTNSLIIMASKSDITTIEEIIKDMDMMLSQVLIESVIIEVQLGDELSTGIDWLQRSMISYRNGANGSRTPVTAFTGMGGGGKMTPIDATVTPEAAATGGLTHYLTLFDINVDMVLQMVSKDDRSKVISAPVILTTDNTEAVIKATEKIYVFSGTTRYNDSENTFDDYDTEEVGLTLTVTPRINEKKMVMMEISQEMSEPGTVGEPQSGSAVSSTRSLEAQIAVSDRQTIVLGGQVRNQKTKSRVKIPFLGDIPLLGRLFNYTNDSNQRREMVVFITPYVIDTPEEIARETARRKQSLNIEGMWKRGWSDSALSEPEREMEHQTSSKNSASDESVSQEAVKTIIDENAVKTDDLEDPLEANNKLRAFIEGQENKYIEN